jgi:catecholate siderophore receptor
MGCRCPRAVTTAVVVGALAAGLGDEGLAETLVVPPAVSSGAEEPVTEVVYVYGTRDTYRESASSTATRTSTPLEELAQSVFVITRDVIDDQALTGLGGLVRYVPGVTMGQGEGHRDAPVFRGNLTTSDFFVDGVRDDLQYLRDLYNVERVDVVKGPSAIVFGRGTGGGALNRVNKSANGERVRGIDVALGMYGQMRVATDLGDAVGEGSAVRLNAMVEESEVFRDEVAISRRGVAPAWSVQLTDHTRWDFFAEYFSDERTVDRGVPSQAGTPWQGPRETFFGNPDLSNSDIEVLTGRAVLTHAFGDALSFRGTVSYGEYTKFYDNVYAGGAVDTAGVSAKISSYLSATDRQNLLAQADLIWQGELGGFDQTLLLGLEAGRQESVNLRINTASAVFPLTDRGRHFSPDFTIDPALDNRNDLNLLAILLQSQITLTPTIDAIVGMRWDRFDLGFDDLRPGSTDFSRTDTFISPKVGIVWEPIEGLSVYGGWSQAYLPQSGEQFNSLNASLVALEPEKFANLEVGLRWQPLPSLLMSAALYQLDRTNTRAPGAIAGTTVLTGSQRSEGIEFGLQGELRDGWHIIGAMAFQQSEVTSTTAAAPAGQKSPLVPQFSASLWSRIALSGNFDIALGVIHQDEQFASITNAVTLPRYTRLDAALFYSFSQRLKAQLNFENLTNERYWFTAHNDNNITPGAGVLARLTISTRF